MFKPNDLRPVEHFSSRERYSFCLYLDMASADVETDSATALHTLTWNINWGALLPPTYLSTSAKWRVTHDFHSNVYQTMQNSDIIVTGWVGLYGLPGMQSYCPTPTIPSGFAPINIYRTVYGPQTAAAWTALLAADPAPFVCASPGGTSSPIKLIMAPLNMGAPAAAGSPDIGGIHRLRFDLISDV
jgi:hypothetical protein